MTSETQTLLRTEHYLSALARGHVGSQTTLPEPVVKLMRSTPAAMHVEARSGAGLWMAPAWEPASTGRIRAAEKLVMVAVLAFFACGVLGVLGRL
jgi:hypothetical protein